MDEPIPVLWKLVLPAQASCVTERHPTYRPLREGGWLAVTRGALTLHYTRMTSSGMTLMFAEMSQGENMTLPTPSRRATVPSNSTRSRLTVDQRGSGWAFPFSAFRSALKNDVTDACSGRFCCDWPVRPYPARPFLGGGENTFS